MGTSVAVVGASGYAGGELLRLLAGHPEFELVAATAHSQAGQPVSAVHPRLTGTRYVGVTFAAGEPSVVTQAGADVVFIALPHGQSAAFAAALDPATRVVDLGADHRLADSDAWARYYSGVHAGTWTYGLPELPGQRAVIASSTRVAATGCYAVATTLALAPLIAADLVAPDDVVVIAASGTTGAGRDPSTRLLASEIIGNVSAYKVGAHQHVPEIKQATGAVTLSFTPLLVPMTRGILATVTARPAHAGITAEQVRDVLRAAYEGEQFVHVLPADQWPRTSATVSTNECHLQATVDADAGRVIVTSAIDNLGKGAAGQAIQCANLMAGLPEATGLVATTIRR